MTDNVKSRDSYFRKIKRVFNTANSHDAIPLTPEAVLHLIDQADAHMKKIEAYHQLILATCADDAAIDIQEAVIEGIEETFLDTKVKLFQIQRDLRQPTRPTATSSSRVKLPTMDLAAFDGRYDNWTSFKDLFMSTIDNNAELSDAQKLQYLKTALKEQPFALIKSLQVNNANYNKAWDLLNKRYENEREIVFSIIDRLFAPSQVSQESPIELQKLIDNAKECLGTLETLKVPVQHWDSVLVYFYVKKLDSNTRREWAIRLTGTSIPTFQELADFVESHSRGLLASGVNNQKATHQGRSDRRQMTAHHVSSDSKCLICNKPNHPLFKCQEFNSKSPADRNALVKRLHLCFNCLKKDHRITDCTNASRCKKCKRKHHTMLHSDHGSQQHVNQTDPNAGSGSGFSAHPPPFISGHAASSDVTVQVLLSTALVTVKDCNGSDQTCRIMLDTGSQGTFISEDCVRRLGIKRHWSNIQVTGISSSTAGSTKGKSYLTLISNFNNLSLDVVAHILPKVTGVLPRYPCKFVEWQHIKGLQLADPGFHQPGPIDILLGADYVGFIMREGRRSGPAHTPVAQETLFGWILSGRVTIADPPVLTSNVAEFEVDSILQKFWEVEEPPHQLLLTEEERKCEQHFSTTYRRADNGKFMLQLPFHLDKKNQLGASRATAVRRLLQVERRLRSNPQHALEYKKFMEEYANLGHMEPIPPAEAHETIGKTFYLPHHFVLQSSSTTTKFRVVFDGSAKTSSGISLNDTLMVGATVQDELYSILLRFRIHQYVLKTDIAKMYRQFLIVKPDADYQRIVWRSEPQQQIQDYRLLTVTYGTGSASHQATRCLQQLAQDTRNEYPQGSSALHDDTYVDDMMSGGDTEDEAIQLYKEVTAIASTANLELRKWSSNSPKVLAAIPSEHREAELRIGIEKDCMIKALGVQWSTSSDCFTFSVNQNVHGNIRLTKRLLLSELAKVFDPIGFLTAVTITAKLLLQELWKLTINWDEILPEHIQERWSTYTSELKNISQVFIPRCIIPPNATHLELHGFCDASEKAYGAVIYLRSITSEGSVHVNFVTSKSKVAPIKQITLPRLELCGAVVLSKLITHVKSALKLSCEVFCWCDSTITLRWLAASPRRWKTYIANRVAIVQEATATEAWRHVPGEQNPADLLSRGIPAAHLSENDFWWHGPAWLSASSIPVFTTPIQNDVDMEERKVVLLVNQVMCELTNKYSSLTKANRVAAYISRFIFNIKKGNHQHRRSGPLTPQELQDGHLMCIREVQQHHFQDEIKALRKSIKLPLNSKLKQLDPYIDGNGILRVGGRLSKAILPDCRKHQAILPKHSNFTTILIHHHHHSHLHSGFQQTWSNLQNQYWILGGRDIVRFLIRRCVTCRRHRAETATQLMGNLPSPRVMPARPFVNTGVDYAGPFMLRNMIGRSSKVYKGYICLFVCMATKAIHLEVVSDLTTDAFIATLRRFVSRRGFCSNIYSDCGSNFIGADSELKRLFNAQNHNNNVSDYLSTNNVHWHFNSPLSPHHGGLWEAGVKSAKFHLKRVVGNCLLNFEQFQTILCQVEAVLNSRPLCPLSSDPSDPEALTPGHFLIGEPLTALPDAEYTDVKENRLSHWQRQQQRVQHFWKRWSSEYLNTLQQRTKWYHDKKGFQVGDLVVIKDDLQPAGKWKVGRITQTHAGDDNRVRTVQIKTSTTELTRPIVKLIPLIDSDSMY